GELLDLEVQPWKQLYARIEEVRSQPSPEGLLALADLIRDLRVLELDPRGRFTHPEAVSFQKTACLAIAECLLVGSRDGEDLDLAESLVAVCPASDWERAYFEVLGEAFDDEGDLDLVREFLERAYGGAVEAGESRATLRSLRRLRRLLARSDDEEAVPPWSGPLPDLLTSVHVAAALGISLRTARGKMTDGSIPCTKFGRQRYARKDDFLALFEPDSR
ncbi:MAG: helix-turn-helix domain-containing protein, partial [Planctomycetota bacterium]